MNKLPHKNTKYLDISTLFVGKFFYEYDQLPSTNTTAIELLSTNSLHEGTVISTVYQYAGKGQMGNTWESDKGKNIALSIILHPRFLSPVYQFQLNKAIALAVRDTIADFVHETVYVKWPNDIYCQDQKVAGILIQNTLAGNKFQSSVVGIGINVNQAKFGPTAQKATSIQLLTHLTQDITAIQGMLCQYVEHRYLQLKYGNAKLLDEIYLKHLYLRHKWAWFERISDNMPFEGNIQGVTEYGQLIVKSHQLEKFDIKAIKFLGEHLK